MDHLSQHRPHARRGFRQAQGGRNRPDHRLQRVQPRPGDRREALLRDRSGCVRRPRDQPGALEQDGLPVRHEAGRRQECPAHGGRPQRGRQEARRLCSVQPEGRGHRARQPDQGCDPGHRPGLQARWLDHDRRPSLWSQLPARPGQEPDERFRRLLLAPGRQGRSAGDHGLRFAGHQVRAPLKARTGSKGKPTEEQTCSVLVIRLNGQSYCEQGWLWGSEPFSYRSRSG